MIRIERLPLPDGLRALAHRDADGGLVVFVSSTLDAPVQRTAVMAAVRASRRSGGRTAAPLGLALLVPLQLVLRRWRDTATALRRSVTLARHARPVAWVAAGTVVATGAVVTGLVLTAPAPAHRSSGPRAAAGPGSRPSAGQGHRPRDVRPAAAVPARSAGALAGQPQAARHSLAAPTSAAPTSAAPTASPAPAPSPAPSASTSPSPSPAPTSGPPSSCVIVLGLPVCVPVSVSASVGV